MKLSFFYYQPNVPGSITWIGIHSFLFSFSSLTKKRFFFKFLKLTFLAFKLCLTLKMITNEMDITAIYFLDLS